MRYIRENANKVREYLKNRNSDFDLDGFLKLDEERRTLLYEVETLKKERNESSTLIGKYKKEGKDRCRAACLGRVYCTGRHRAQSGRFGRPVHGLDGPGCGAVGSWRRSGTARRL